MFYQKKLHSVALLLITFALGACSSAPKSADEDDKTPPLSEIRTQMGTLNARIAELEAKIGSLNGKLETLQTPVATSAPDQMVRTAAAPVIPHPADRAGTAIAVAPAPSDPDAGFVSDSAVQSYRKALVLLQSRQHSEAVLAFSTFLEQNPDHVLAGSAQYYVGEAYFLQKEYKLALQEFRRVLTSYDRSAHIPQALQKMALAEEALNLKNDARAHRQLLSSLYPQSPAAAERADAQSEAPAETSSMPILDGPPPTAPLDRNRDNAKH